MSRSVDLSSQDIDSDYKSAQLKFLPALQFLTTHPDYRSGKVKWVMLVDDDTYVFSRNLMLTLEQFGTGSPRYIGNVCPETVVQKLNGGPSDDFVMGGGGSLLSREALERMDLQACINRQNSTWKLWQSDWMIGACAAEAGVPAEADQRFHQWLSWQGPGPAREHRFAWAVTLHPVRPNHMMQLSAMRPDINDIPILDTANAPGDPEDEDVAAAMKVAPPHDDFFTIGSGVSELGARVAFAGSGSSGTSLAVAMNRRRDPTVDNADESLTTADAVAAPMSAVSTALSMSSLADAGFGRPSQDTELPRSEEHMLGPMQRGADTAFPMPEPEHAVATQQLMAAGLEPLAASRAPHLISLVQTSPRRGLADMPLSAGGRRASQSSRSDWGREWPRLAEHGGPQTYVVVMK